MHMHTALLQHAHSSPALVVICRFLSKTILQYSFFADLIFKLQQRFEGNLFFCSAHQSLAFASSTPSSSFGAGRFYQQKKTKIKLVHLAHLELCCIYSHLCTFPLSLLPTGQFAFSLSQLSYSEVSVGFLARQRYGL